MLQKNLKIITTVFFLIIFSSVYYAQEPQGYYNGTESLSGESLRSKLYLIIKDHNSISYNQLWSAYEDTDKRPDGKVWDVYSDCDFVFVVNQDGGSGGSSECQYFNREHSVPQSWFGGASPTYSDLFHVIPADKKVNNVRSSFPLGEVGNSTYTSRNGSKLGSSKNSGYNGTVFEPIDDYKGDFARIYFYMATRYSNVCNSWGNGTFSSANSGLSNYAVELFLRWHNSDPVSEKEINRNNAVYSYQSNRNPFIDHPEFANKIWNPNYVESPMLYIVSPQNGAIVNINEVEISFGVENFRLNIDGKVKYKLNNNFIGYSIENPIIISGLANNQNTISLELVDNNNNSLNPVVIKEITISFNELSYVSSISSNQPVEVFPNPAYDFIEINIEDLQDVITSVYVTDISGKIIFKEDNYNENSKLYVGDKETGIYFISLKTLSEKVYSQRFVVIR